MKKLIISVSFHLEINSMSLFEVFTVMKDSTLFSLNNCTPFPTNLQRKTLHSFILTISASLLILKFMIDLPEQLPHIYCSFNILEIFPGKCFYIFLTVKMLGLENGNTTIKPIFSKVDGTHNLKN